MIIDTQMWVWFIRGTPSAGECRESNIKLGHLSGERVGVDAPTRKGEAPVRL